jgi:hypothetical protein
VQDEFAFFVASIFVSTNGHVEVIQSAERLQQDDLRSEAVDAIKWSAVGRTRLKPAKMRSMTASIARDLQLQALTHFLNQPSLHRVCVSLGEGEKVSTHIRRCSILGIHSGFCANVSATVARALPIQNSS